MRVNVSSSTGNGRTPGNVRFALATLAALLSLPASCTSPDRQAAAARPAKEPVDELETVEEFWPNGQLRLRKDVVRNADGTLVNHGNYAQWHDNGQAAYEATYIHGELHGVGTAWHKNGQKWTEEHYDHGLRHGPRYSWDEDGMKCKEEHYFNDRPHGTWTTWKKDGSIKSQGSFDHGTPVAPRSRAAGKDH